MRRNAQMRRLLYVMLLFVLPAVAGQGLQCPTAASSSSGNFLVLTEIALEKRNEQISLFVFPKETFDNNKWAAPGRFWAEVPRWSVVVNRPGRGELECFVPLVTDDGEFMVLVRRGLVSSGEDAVLQVYRRDHHEPGRGILVKNIELKEIWKTPGKLGENLVSIWTDGTPEWFAGGTFEFSSDYRQLIHSTRFGNTVQINLENGSVAQLPH